MVAVICRDKIQTRYDTNSLLKLPKRISLLPFLFLIRGQERHNVIEYDYGYGNLVTFTLFSFLIITFNERY